MVVIAALLIALPPDIGAADEVTKRGPIYILTGPNPKGQPGECMNEHKLDEDTLKCPQLVICWFFLL